MVKQAISDQIALSSELRKFVEEVGDVEDGTLFEAMFRCDRRMSELYTLAADMSQIAAQASPSKEDSERLQAKARVLLPSKALEMHGTEEAMAHVKKEVLQPLADRLESLAALGDGGIHAGEISALRVEVAEMRLAVSEMREHGIVCDGGKGVVRPDGGLLDGIVHVLDEVDAKMSNVTKILGDGMIKDFFKKDVAEDCRFKMPRLPRKVQTVAPQLYEASRLRAQIDVAAREYESLLSDPVATHQQRRAALAAILAKMSALMSIDASTLKEQTMRYGDAMRQSADDLWCALRRDAAVLHAKLVHLDVMYRRMDEMQSEDFLTGRSALEVFEGRLRSTTLVEARIRGIADEDVDPALDDRNVRFSKKLGSGAANTVYAVTYEDGETYVFKPEAPGRNGLEYLCVGECGAYDAAQQVVQLNVATSKVAAVLGAEEAVVKTSAGTHSGQYGLFMEKAPGVTCDEFLEGRSGGGESLSIKDIRGLPPDERREVKAGLMRGLNRLQWLDVITGQSDRHRGNYMIDVRPNPSGSAQRYSVSVKGIDNDACFTKWRTGLHTIEVGPDKYAEFVESLQMYAKEAYGRSTSSDVFCDRFRRENGVEWDEEARTIRIDLSQCGRTGEVAFISKLAFSFHSIAIPELIDADLCDHILALGDDSESRSRFLKDLEKRLTPDAYRVALVRLDQVVAHVRNLKAKTPERVISADLWATEVVQNHRSQTTAAADQLDFRNVGRLVPIREPKSFAVEALEMHLEYANSDLYARDIAATCDL